MTGIKIARLDDDGKLLVEQLPDEIATIDYVDDVRNDFISGGAISNDTVGVELVGVRQYSTEASRTIRIIGRSDSTHADGYPTRLYAGVESLNAGRLLVSTDNGATWTILYTHTNRYNFANVLELASGGLLATVRISTATQQQEIWRCTDRTGAAWSTVLTFQGAPVNSQILHDPSWFEDPLNDGTIYAGEYGDNNGAPSTMAIWKSEDDGLTWTAKLSRADIRHYHNVQPDPYEPGRIWFCAGDSAAQSRVGYSDDGCESATWVVVGSAGLDGEEPHNQSRTCQFAFTDDAVFWGSDNHLTGELRIGIYKWSRATETISQVYVGANNAIRGTIVDSQGRFLAWTEAADPDDYVEFFASADGDHWQLVDRWRRRKDLPSLDVIPKNVLAPDANDEFWVYWANLDGSVASSGDVSTRLRLYKRKAFDAQQSGMSMEAQFKLAQQPQTISKEINSVLLASGATQEFTVMASVPADYVVEDAWFSHDNAANIAASATDYWTVSVRHSRNGNAVDSTTKALWGGADIALARRTSINKQNTSLTSSRGKTGDRLILQFAATGSPVDIVRPTVTLLLKRLNVARP